MGVNLAEELKARHKEERAAYWQAIRKARRARKQLRAAKARQEQAP